MDWLSALFGSDATVLRERQFQVLLAANVLPPMGTSLLSPVLDSLIDPFGVSPAEIGLMMAAYTAPSILITPLVGVLVDRYGRKTLLSVGLVLFGFGGTAIAFTTAFGPALWLRLVQGIGFAGVLPIIITSIGDRYEGTSETAAQGFRFTGSGLTQTVIPLLSGGLVVIAWQYPFLLYTAAFPVAALVILRFEEPADLEHLGSETDRGAFTAQARELFALTIQPRVAAILLARGLPTLAWIGFLTYNSVFIVQVIGGTPTQAGIVAAAGSLTYAGSATQVGRITAHFDNRSYPLVGANLAVTVGLAVLMVTPSVLVGIAGIALMGFGYGIALTILRSHITGIPPTELRGGLVSLSEAFGRVTSTAAPVGMGGIIAGLTPLIGFGDAIRVAGLGVAGIAGIGGLICVVVAERSPRIEDR